MFFAYILYGIFAGYFAGFLGMGAGVFLMPFYTIMGIPYETAVDASLMSVFSSSFASSTQFYKSGEIPWEPCVIIGVAGAISATWGSFYLIHIISPIILQFIFAGLMFLNIDLLRLINRRTSTPVGLKEKRHKRYFFSYLFIGFLSGLTASLLGIGGGILMVPLLITLANYEVKDAVKVAVVSMVATTLFGMSSELVHNTLPYHIGVPSAIGAVMGGFLGTIALKYVRPSIITKITYVISFDLGLVTLFKAFF